MAGIVVALFLLGLVFIAFEFVIPGGILGVIGGLCILGAWGLSFVHFGAEGGMVAVLGGIVVLAVMLTIEIRLLPRTRFGRKLFLEGEIQATSHRPQGTDEIVGREGETLTPLAPSGVVVIDDRKYEAFSMSGFVEKGARVKVVDFDHFRVRVRKV